MAEQLSLEGYADTMMLGGQPADGPSKNFRDLLIWKYYEQKAYVDRTWPTAKDERSIFDLLSSLLDFVPESDRHDELVGLVEKFYRKNLSDMCRKRKAEGNEKVQDIDPDDVELVKKKLGNDDLFTCYNDACKQVKYMTQGEMNRAHGLVKERAIGITFPFMAKGRFMFPMSIVPPDGVYVNKLSGREWDFKLQSTLMRRTKTSELNMDLVEDDRHVGWEEDSFPVTRSNTVPRTASGEYIDEKSAAKLEYEEIMELIGKLKEYRPDTEQYDVMGWPKARKIPPITHEEMNKWRKIEDNENFMDISRFLAEVVTGHETMNVLLLGVGASGSGKSVGLNHLLWGIACWIADIEEHDPANWRKYYPYWTNCRVIDKEGFADLFKDLGFLTIKLGDDAFNALNRTKFQSTFIEELNTIAATDRVFRGVTAFSCQWAGMIDKVIRDLAGFRIDFKRNKNARAWNQLNSCKFHILEYNQYDKHNPVYTKYFHTRHVDVEDHFAGKACEEMMEWYDIYRVLGAVMLKKRPKEADEEEEKKNKYGCPECGSSEVRANRKGEKFCRRCGNKWGAEDEMVENAIKEPARKEKPQRAKKPRKQI